MKNNTNNSSISFRLYITFLVIVLHMAHTCHAQINTRDKQTFPLEKIRNSTIIFTFGQSNAANHGQECYSPKNKVYNYYGGMVYEGKDPLVGPTGTGGSVWTRVADMMVDAGISNSVTIVPIAVGATDITSWAEGGNLYEMFIRNVDQMLADGIIPDYIFWHQGESDNIADTSESDYIKKFESIRKVFKSRGIDAPIYIAIASYHPQCLKRNKGICTAVRKAQTYLAKKYKDIFPGPDTDKLDKCIHRHDGVHFSSIGLDLHAKGWLKAIK